MPTTDSVFDPLLYQADDTPTPYEDDRSILSLAQIKTTWEQITDEALNQITDILAEETAALMQRATPLLDDRNQGAIANLTWNASTKLQKPIGQVWEAGFDVGADHGHREMLISLPNNYSAREVYALPQVIKDAIASLIEMNPPAFLNFGARQAVLNRVIYLAGNFSNAVITQFRQSLIAAIAPQPNTGYPITRQQLMDQLKKTLNVGAVRAEAIARTELTNAYNTGRVSSFQQSSLVEYVRFLAIDDNRISDICKSRNGLIIPVTQQAAIARNTPALHVHCRSTLSPVMPKVNKLHQSWVDDPGRRISNRQLVPLPEGWQ